MRTHNSTSPVTPVTKKKCPFTEADVKYIDYKDLALLSRYITEYKKIKPKYYTGVSLYYQKKLARAIKNARTMALLPFISGHK